MLGSRLADFPAADQIPGFLWSSDDPTVTLEFGHQAPRLPIADMALDTAIGQHLCRAVASIFRELHPVRYLRSGTASRSGLRKSEGSSASGRPMNVASVTSQRTPLRFGEAQVCAEKFRTTRSRQG
jgi:hypothetical protein